jgi:hypothetical protein
MKILNQGMMFTHSHFALGRTAQTLQQLNLAIQWLQVAHIVHVAVSHTARQFLHHILVDQCMYQYGTLHDNFCTIYL